ncbi:MULTISPECIES: acyltransferase family protein [unclassified Arthrobacter]|uniref:acyltransferase family protein n=1 Tax=unclassified Arthrobacter TaxID=235627 RepID=UPI0024DFB104|nr:MULTISPECIES: acyltransferase family protein [unclassified Arthrobacter]MCC9146483.1 acyltransferase [Arthrobacter sp. zg-Y919]MDK1277713.1 acyltransferase family protein [Arthrobacter sp. zg.Y919]WIB02331.1 acyltransferase family protein [Arthrobacter sp. zg-Y919]
MRRNMLQEGGRYRADIQGLRALAVGLVVIYHVWPAALPGGFVGVDVFFVISGYLIVGSLVRELGITKSIDLVAFYGRRIRRLLPAAATVLLATLAITGLVFPESRWQGVARDAVAASLNVQNWNQAFSAASYAGATAAVSPLQHYWSLAVEEQFYLLVPVLLLLVAAAARSLRTGMAAAALTAICTVSVFSFIHSVMFSSSNPDLAYFFTTTRIWELGLGGILAVTAAGRRLPPWASLACGWSGLLMIGVAAATFTTSMFFPGWVALLPTLGTVLCILAGSGPAASFTLASAPWWQSLRPVTYLGDISYSLYLWHWPVTVFTVYALGHGPGPYYGIAIIGTSIILGALSTRFVEKPFRHIQGRGRGPGRHGAARTTYRPVYALAAVLVAVPVAAAAVPYATVQHKIDTLGADYDLAPYPGAMAFDADNPVRVPSGQPVRPEPAAAMSDQPVIAEACSIYDPANTPYSECVYGDPDGSKSIVLVGDSHAAHFMSPLNAAARDKGFRLYVLTRNGCPFNARALHSDTFVYTNCSSQNLQTVKDILAIGPELVVTSAMRPESYANALGWTWDVPKDAVDGYLEVLEPLEKAGIRIGVIGDVPYPETSVPDCVLQESDMSECSVPHPAHTGDPDPLLEAAERLEGSTIVDLTPYFCGERECPPVIGNVLAYRDNHITDTFARTLGEPLRRGLGL